MFACRVQQEQEVEVLAEVADEEEEVRFPIGASVLAWSCLVLSLLLAPELVVPIAAGQLRI